MSSICAFAQSQQPARTESVFKVSTRLVVVDAQVLDRKTGKAIENLQSQDFLLHEDGVLQEITNFSRDKLPLSIVLLFDVTATVRPVLKQLASGAENSLQHLKKEDEVAVMVFSESALLLDELTTDRQRAVSAIRRASETAVSNSDRAYLNEAAYQAAAYLKKASDSGRRRVVVILNDALANIPRRGVHSEKEAITEAFESGTTICGLVARSSLSSVMGVAYTKNPAFMLASKLDPPGSVYTYARRTGGDVLKTQKEEVELKLADLFDNLRARYSLGYISSNPALNGKFRSIKLRLRSATGKGESDIPIVRAKQGYYARKEETP